MPEPEAKPETAGKTPAPETGRKPGGTTTGGIAAGEDEKEWGKGGPVKIVKGERRLNRVRIVMTPPW